MLVLAFSALAASGAYVAFGPSARTSPVTFTATGRSESGGAAAHAQTSRPRHPHQAGHHPHSMSGHGHGVIPVSGHGHGTKPHPPQGSKHFGVRVGHVAGLYPGSTNPVKVRYRNPNSFALDVTRVVVSGGSSGACAPNYFVNGTYTLTSPVHVSPHRSVKTTVPFGMKKSAPDACQGVHVTVDVTATAVRS